MQTIDIPDLRPGRPPIILPPDMAASALLALEADNRRRLWLSGAGRHHHGYTPPTKRGGSERWHRAGWENPPALNFARCSETRSETRSERTRR